MADLTALRTAIFAALAKADGFEPEQLEPDDYETQITAVVPLVLAARTAAFAEAANALDAQSCACGCRRGADFLRTLAERAAVSAPGGE